MNLTQARIADRLLERLRQHGQLTVSQSTTEADLQALLELPVSRNRFWRAVAELEENRELAVTPASLAYRDPASRW